MKNEYNVSFDLPTLLKLGDLNIRGIAETKASLSASEYFDMLMEFTILAQAVSSALKRFADRDGDKNTCKNLDNMATLLTDLGCDKFIPDFYSILDAYGKGDWRLAATHAKKILGDFDEFYSRTMTAKKTQRSKALDDLSHDNQAALNEIPLREFIKQLEDEEANRKLLILAVDDSPVILKSVSSVLSNEYKVLTLAKPTMLEKTLHQITPDLFLLDYQMPELTGFDLVPIIRSFEEHKDTPIIFLTSIGTIDNVSSALMLGACDFVVKPVHPDILREKIAKHIRRKKLV